MFDVEDYLRLVNWSSLAGSLTDSDLSDPSKRLISRVAAALGVETFDHGVPAAELAAHRDEFFGSISDATLDRFETLIELLNNTIPT